MYKMYKANNCAYILMKKSFNFFFMFSYGLRSKKHSFDLCVYKNALCTKLSGNNMKTDLNEREKNYNHLNMI